MIMKFLLVALVLLVGSCSAQPSKDEFDLFCKLLGEANSILHGPGYVYDEDKDKEVLKEMQMLYNATTDNMNQFRKTLWETKDFFEEHPPPTQPENRRKAHREIGDLITKGEKKIEENRELAKQINEKMKEAKLPVAQGMYGDGVNEIPKDEGQWAAIRDNTTRIFNSKDKAADSCGGGGNKQTGKTLINDLFCVCVGEGSDAERPCHPKIWPPKSWPSVGGCNNDNNNCKWTLIKFGSVGTPTLIHSFNESFEKIEQVCREEMTEKKVKSENIPILLDKYVGLIGKGDEQVKKDKSKKIFGHSGKSKDKTEVKDCTGAGSSNASGNKYGMEKHNDNICVDYTQNLQGDKYNIPWHKKFREAAEEVDQAKKLEEKILKNRADLLLLKSQAWVAYGREKDDETSNLDDMNVSNLFDGARLPTSFPPFPFPFLFLFLIL
ncbi:Variant surface glycoprotein [Trypanosoma congolense IL3000]|uniref:Variant surface glycoprotein n=1 Tax=Trypanosoma congolense (strain IL3000) TaxID=1068625 RepID=F9WI37_TRYCI|nr:Variant surface glycoprotein [Trypanosoma congolense IL3000]